ncbi:aromatic ring-hydroxylating dioxygenase subunit alpha [bacterium]|jgi:phenylpropionate dioxygenase-like ring-hydroxylating dioxygenase large terminal subunit|nr:aromatic ring-hydroxylating dioxygenase subunit alpha [bacterium]|tara:strand:- start:3159 stop:4271 length:1113 start_codon:yes stop_codon:yes gene_type:complete
MVGDFVTGEKGAFSDCAQDSFTLPSRYYTDPDIYHQEMHSIFQCSWLYVGHVSDLPDVGSYLTVELVGQPILIVRSQGNELSAFFNVCQHRGHALLSGRGQLRNRIVCPYHAWCYGLDGALLAARMTRDIPNFDLGDFSLKPVQLTVVAGLLFINFDPKATPADGDLLDFEETILTHLPEMPKYATKHRLDFDVVANWKVVVDNFSEGYHIPIAHPTLTKLYNEKGGSSRIGKFFGCYQKTAQAGFKTLGTKGGEPYITWFLWPNLCLLSLPGSPQLIVLRISPNGPGRSLEHADIYGPTNEDFPNLEAAKSLFAEMFNREDIALVESVQRGLESLGYDQGRYVADPAESWFTESGLHRFHSQILEALNR